MSSECQGRVAAERDQQVEGVARDDQGAGAFRTLEGAGEHQGGRLGGARPLRAEEEVAHHDHAAPYGDRQASDGGVARVKRSFVGHLPSIVTAIPVAGR